MKKKLSATHKISDHAIHGAFKVDMSLSTSSYVSEYPPV
jgi:hypothetical protein